MAYSRKEKASYLAGHKAGYLKCLRDSGMTTERSYAPTSGRNWRKKWR